MSTSRRDPSDLIWRGLLALAALDLLILAGTQSWGAVEYSVLVGALFGIAAWRGRRRVRPFVRRAGLDNFAGFLLMATAIGAAEEIVCWALGNSITDPILWADLVQVCGGWLFWFAAWYLYLSKKFAYSEKEGLLLGAGVGVLFEGVSSGALLVNPVLTLLMAPLVIAIYAAIFVVPMQLIGWSGTSSSRLRYPAGVLIPYLASLPTGVALAIVLPR